MYCYGPPHMTGQKQDDRHENTFSSNVRIRNVPLKTCQRRWTIGKSGERVSGISVLVARHDDDDDDVNRDRDRDRERERDSANSKLLAWFDDVVTQKKNINSKWFLGSETCHIKTLQLLPRRYITLQQCNNYQTREVKYHNNRTCSFCNHFYLVIG